MCVRGRVRILHLHPSKPYTRELVSLQNSMAIVQQWKQAAFSKLHRAKEMCPKNEKSK